MGVIRWHESVCFGKMRKKNHDSDYKGMMCDTSIWLSRCVVKSGVEVYSAFIA
jgi:hypothetical protein